MSTAIHVTDHEEIRRWAQENKARPACVKGTGKGSDPGILRFDFDKKDESLEEISWDKWLEWFDRNELALLLSEDSRFSKLVRRN
jgi:hypothetical protein